jgi:Leucine-rich repeat (LRR) protein
MKKLLSLIAIVLLATMAAQAATDYGFSVAGTTVTSDNCNNITNSYITSGTVSYNPSNNTLFMNNVTINMTGSYNRVINNLENSDLTVMFRGTCNLKAQDASVIRIRKSTTLWAPQATDVVNITGVNDVGIWMATTNDFDLTIQGPGTFNISSTKQPAIEDEDNTSSAPITLDKLHEVYFDNVNAVLSSSQNSVIKRFLPRFKAGSSVRFKATNNSSYPVVNYCGWQVYGNEALLEPYGAYHDGSYVVDSNGNRVYNNDVYVSDNYVAIINATNFPDANFRSRMLSLIPKGYITSDHVNAYDYLNLSNSNISNLKGIEYFTNLETLQIQNNNLTSVDLSHNTKLKTLNCYNNQLSSLDLSNQSSLEYLDCSNNKLTTLTASNKSSLKTLNCSNNTLLTTLNCYSDNLTTLNVTGCTALKTLKCYYNANLATITGLAGCTAITYLDCEDCAITNLSAVQSMNSIEKLYARNNKLTSLNVGELSYLKTLRVSGNTLLTTLYCYSCDLTNLYVTGCSSLTYIDCSYNQLTSLDVTGCSALNHLEIYSNKISGTGMTTLVNSLPTRTASNKGVLYAVLSNDNNSMTAAQITTARNKYWLPKKYSGGTWVDMTASTRGDVNGDGSVTIDDVTALIDILLTGSSATSGADCNQDGNVTIDDVTALIDYLLSGSW